MFVVLQVFKGAGVLLQCFQALVHTKRISQCSSSLKYNFISFETVEECTSEVVQVQGFICGKVGANDSSMEDFVPPPPPLSIPNFAPFLTKFLNETLQVDEHQWDSWSDLRWRVSLVPRSPMFLPSICVHNNTQNRKTSKSTGKAWEHSSRTWCVDTR